MVLAPYNLCEAGSTFLKLSSVLDVIHFLYMIQSVHSCLTNHPEANGQLSSWISHIHWRHVLCMLNYIHTLIRLGLITAILYTYAQENRGEKIKFMIITMNVKWLPWANMFLNFVINGIESTKIMFVGIAAAHLYDFLTRLWPAFGGGRSIVRTPTFISNISGGPRHVTVAKHGTVFRPPTQLNSTYSSGWGSRGQGRRLGGE